MRVLIVEDEKRIRDFLKEHLKSDYYEIDVAADGQKGLEFMKINNYDLVILDNVLPKKTGLEVCTEARKAGVTSPILVLSVLSDSKQKIALLEAGADDYLCKPFNVRELLARVRALVRRSSFLDEKANNLQHDCLSLVVDEHRFAVNGKDIHLTVRGFSLMEALLESPKQVISRDRLLEQVWGADYFGDVTVVDTYIKYLRAKLAKEGVGEMIKTVRGVGFTLRDS